LTFEPISVAQQQPENQTITIDEQPQKQDDHNRDSEGTHSLADCQSTSLIAMSARDGLLAQERLYRQTLLALARRGDRIDAFRCDALCRLWHLATDRQVAIAVAIGVTADIADRGRKRR
jgi:hypothetical protein